MSKKDVAIIYDFDGTLAKGNMQDYNFIPDLGMEIDDFWLKVEKTKKEHNMETPLAYMYLTLKEAKEKGVKLTKSNFMQYGKNISFFEGVTTWFKRINEYASLHSLNIHHFIVSSGIKEIIEGTKISNEFERIYACSYMYNEQDEPIWPSVSINYTNKTQFLYRISKGVYDIYDDRVNDKMQKEDKKIPFANMIYIGDGFTDIPSMTIIKEHNGCSLAVYDDEAKKHITDKLQKDGRINFSSKANYTEDSELCKYVKEHLNNIAKGEV